MRIQRCKAGTTPRTHFLRPSLILQKVAVKNVSIRIPQGSFVNRFFDAKEMLDQDIGYIFFGTISRQIPSQCLDDLNIPVFLIGDTNVMITNGLNTLLIMSNQFRCILLYFHISIMHQLSIIKGSELFFLEVKLVRLYFVEQTIDTGLVSGLALVWCLIFCVDEEAGDSATGSSVNAFVPFWRTSRFVERFRIPLNPRFPDISVGE